MFFSVGPSDSLVDLAASAAVVLAALLACYAPVHRVSAATITDALQST